MAQQFEVGDIVQLKSGGPEMTVDEVSNTHLYEEGEPGVWCVWFAGKKRERAHFSVKALIPAHMEDSAE